MKMGARKNQLRSLTGC